MEVVQVRNPRALMIPEVQQLVKQAVESNIIAAPGGFDSVAKDVFDYVTQEHQFMLLGAENGHFKTLVMGFMPNGNLFPYPSVVLFYAQPKTTKALRDATSAKLLDILVSAGYTSAWAFNATGNTDAAWSRFFTIPGRTSIKPLGTVMEIKVT